MRTLATNRTLTHDDEFEEDDLEFCAPTIVHLPIPDMQSHFTTILDDENLTMMTIRQVQRIED